MNKCPKCGGESLLHLPIVGDRDDYKCRNCGLAFSVSGTDSEIFKHGAGGELAADTNGRVWWTRPGRFSQSTPA
jgi:hypothetical protein